MSKIEEARAILNALRVPVKQQTDLCCYVILALANIGKRGKWQNAGAEWMRIHDIIVFTKEKYGVTYAENSRETFRKQALHHLEMPHLSKIMVLQQTALTTAIV